jgi:hypothetical protein
MRGLLVFCDTRTTHLSLRLEPRLLLYHGRPSDPDLATLLGHVRSDELHSTPDACPHHSHSHHPFRQDAKTFRNGIPFNRSFCVREGYCTEKDINCGVSLDRVFGGRHHQRL